MKKEEINIRELSRREFFHKLGTVVLPSIAIMGLGPIVNACQPEDPMEPTGCKGSCAASCYGSCDKTCGQSCEAIGFAPDYDQPYWYMVNYNDFGKALHFVTPFNNTALTQQVALLLPVKGNRLKIGYTFDYTGNELGGHSRSIGSNMFTIGCVMRYQTKKWDR